MTTSLIIRNSVVQGGTSVITGVTSTNISVVNPAFVDSGNPYGVDGLPRTSDDGLALEASSPAINLGDNALIPTGLTTDITGGERILQDTVDAGAY